MEDGRFVSARFWWLDSRVVARLVVDDVSNFVREKPMYYTGAMFRKTQRIEIVPAYYIEFSELKTCINDLLSKTDFQLSARESGHCLIMYSIDARKDHKLKSFRKSVWKSMWIKNQQLSQGDGGLVVNISARRTIDMGLSPGPLVRCCVMDHVAMRREIDVLTSKENWDEDQRSSITFWLFVHGCSHGRRRTFDLDERLKRQR